MKHLVMLGAGHAHVHMLSTLAAQPLAGVRITLVAPYPRQLYSGMVPGFVAGHYSLQDCVIPLEPWLKNSSVSWRKCSATGLDAQQRIITLDDGSSLRYDVLSINSGPVQDRQKIECLMPGAREHALFVRPIEGFAALWPQVVTMGQARPLRFAVMGGGAAGFELACAISYRLPQASVTLLSGTSTVGANYPLRVQTKMQQELNKRHITMLQERAVALASGEITLGSGALLACDVPVLAIGAHPPPWLLHSGLALDAQGFVAVDACQRSTSHAQVFAAGDVATRQDVSLPRSGVYAVRAGGPLTRNLRAVLAGINPSPYTPQHNTLNLLSCGDCNAIASWGNWSAQGRWVWWLKNRIDRGFIRRYSQANTP